MSKNSQYSQHWLRFKARLEELIGHRSAAEFARSIDVDSSTVHHWLKGGRIPHRSVLDRIAQNYDISINWLMGEEGEQYIRLPILNITVGAGNSQSNGEEYVQEYFEMPRTLVPMRGNISVVQVVGDSMEPTYHSGDLVMVSPTNGGAIDGVMVVGWDDALVVKRVMRIAPAKIKLISDNPAYESVTLDLQDVRLVGRVIGLIRWQV